MANILKLFACFVTKKYQVIRLRGLKYLKKEEGFYFRF